MTGKWLTNLNLGIAALIGVLLVGAFGLFLTRPATVHPESIAKAEALAPKNSFRFKDDAYQAIGNSALSLSFSPLSAQLPDLRRHLIFYGKNGRPDATDTAQALYFAFNGNKALSSLTRGDRLYILYDKYLNPPQYVFSPNNAKTPLWIEAEQKGTQALVKVSMIDEEGDVIRTPQAYAEFPLPEKEFMKVANSTWELGKWRVDGTLLARQKARWYGIDRFIELHGGDEYTDWMNRQRIDFGEGDSTYSVYVGPGECMVWMDGHWEVTKPSSTTLNYPILCVRKVDERILNLELWDVGGKGKISLNLVKSNEQWVPKNLEDSFKFLGARTRSQFIFEIQNERTFLSPHDWLVLTDGEWKKLITPQDIDDYVQRKIVGPLFIFEGIEKHDDKQVISGTLFNTSRTEMVPMELQLQPTPVSTPANIAKKQRDEKNRKVRETNHPSMVKVKERGVDHHMMEYANPPNDDDDDDYEDD